MTKKKHRLKKIILLILIMVSFIYGYLLGFNISLETSIDNQEQTAYELIQEGLEELEEN